MGKAWNRTARLCRGWHWDTVPGVGHPRGDLRPGTQLIGWVGAVHGVVHRLADCRQWRIQRGGGEWPPPIGSEFCSISAFSRVKDTYFRCVHVREMAPGLIHCLPRPPYPTPKFEISGSATDRRRFVPFDYRKPFVSECCVNTVQKLNCFVNGDWRR